MMYGSPRPSELFEFDIDGNCIRESSIDLEGKKRVVEENIYVNSRKIESLDSYVKTYYFYKNNKLDYLTMKVLKHFYGIDSLIIKYSYNNYDSIVKKEVLDDKGQTLVVTNYEYNSDKLIVKEERDFTKVGSDIKLSPHFIYRFSPNKKNYVYEGTRLIELRTTSNNDLGTDWHTFTYHLTQNGLKETVDQWKYEHNIDGAILSYGPYFTKISYNKYNLETIETFTDTVNYHNNTRTYSYEYDYKNNWIKQSCSIVDLNIQDPINTQVIERNITYY